MMKINPTPTLSNSLNFQQQTMATALEHARRKAQERKRLRKVVAKRNEREARKKGFQPLDEDSGSSYEDEELDREKVILDDEMGVYSPVSPTPPSAVHTPPSALRGPQGVKMNKDPNEDEDPDDEDDLNRES